MNNSIPGTVCCILCRGTIIYKDGDKQRFRAHLNNEHGAFYDIDYLLASSLMDIGQKETVARSVNISPGVNYDYSDQGLMSNDDMDQQETLRENVDDGVTSDQANTVRNMKRERPDYIESDSISYSQHLVDEQSNPKTTHQEEQVSSSKRKPRRKKKVEAEHVVDEATETATDDKYPGMDGNSIENSSIESMEVNNDETQDDVNQDDNNLSQSNQVNEDQDKVKPAAGDKERFACQFEGCGKSYTMSTNRITHERKAHGLLGKRSAAKKQRMSVSTAEDDNVPTLTDDENVATATDEGPDPVPDNVQPVNSFLTNDSLGLGMDDSTDNDDTAFHSADESTEVVTENKVENIVPVDLSTSRYFEKNPKVVATARGKALTLFDDIPEGLPVGWKLRNVEVNTKSGDKQMSKHFLAPEQKVLKTGLAVVEYLRIKGEHTQEELEQIAKKLNVADKKFRSLF